MLRNGIWWLGRVEFLPESFKHLICSRIRVSTVACRMALHDMPNPHLVDQENCLLREKSQTGDTHRVSRRISFPFLSIATFKNKNIVHIYINQETKTSAMAPPTCNEIKCAAFMLHMGIRLGEKQSCKTWQKWQMLLKTNEHHVQTSEKMKCFSWTTEMSSFRQN